MFTKYTFYSYKLRRTKKWTIKKTLSHSKPRYYKSFHEDIISWWPSKSCTYIPENRFLPLLLQPTRFASSARSINTAQNPELVRLILRTSVSKTRKWITRICISRPSPKSVREKVKQEIELQPFRPYKKNTLKKNASNATYPRHKTYRTNKICNPPRRYKRVCEGPSLFLWIVRQSWYNHDIERDNGGWNKLEELNLTLLT